MKKSGLRVLSAAAAAAIFALASAVFLPAQKQGDPVVVGTYETMASKILGEERTLLIGLPDGYDDSTASYPVLYLLDGDIDLFGEIQSFAKARCGFSLPPMIVVGIKNTRRNRDMIPGPDREQAHLFLKFLTDELFGRIEARFRTKPFRILYGGSNAGLFVVYALLENPGAFSAFLAASPMVMHRLEYMTKKAAAAPAEHYRGKYLYVIYGDKDLRAEVRESIRSYIPLLERLRAGGLRMDVRDLPEEGHVPFGSVQTGLFNLFDGYAYPAEKRRTEGLDAAESYYEQFSKKIGFQVDVPRVVAMSIGVRDVEAKNYKNAIPALDFALKQAPRDLMINYFLALAHFRDNNMEKAKAFYLRVKDINPAGYPSPEFEEMKKAFDR